MMKWMILTVVFFLFCPAASHAWHGYVVQVLDGDSIRVQRGRSIIEIRLYGIDCPEWGQPFGDKARRYTREKIYRKTVIVEPRDIDKYDRVVALVSYSGGLLNKELVQEGLAWMYPRYCLEQPLCSELQALENSAATSARGLWKETHPLSPWQWKWKNK